jgi:hypothetical protein
MSTDQKQVEISAEAQAALANHVRRWAGWNDAVVDLALPEGIGYCEYATRRISVNAERLLLNPNRLLLTLTPFRLKQEAVLTGALLHEAAHARFSQWRPRSVEAAAEFRHNDGAGDVVSQTAIDLATLMEEPRIEGLMAKASTTHGAAGLEWTMRATAAKMLPYSPELSADPNTQVMEMIGYWALRAGRQYAMRPEEGVVPRWARDFTYALQQVIATHCNRDDNDGTIAAHDVISILNQMIKCEDHTGTTMVDLAQEVLFILFPETEDMPPVQPPPCESAGTGEGGGQGEPGEDESGPESGDEGEGEGEGDSEPGEGESEGEGEGEGEGDSEPESGEPESGEGASNSTETEAQRETREELEALLKQFAQQDNKGSEEETEEGKAAAPADGGIASEEGADDQEGGGAGGTGSGLGSDAWRAPKPEERVAQKKAERFLRNLIAPVESSKVSITDTPSSMIDGAALSAWRASGGHRDPRFFVRTNRTVTPCPPVQIAVLVDVSGSMDVLQEPSAVLSWELSTAALDLRNFAGRGVQVESCLIHWGSTARVIQSNGQALRGIRTNPCMEGTSAMGPALDLVEEQMPGFFDPAPDGKPVHRLLVQFTDWRLTAGAHHASRMVGKALESGVNMLSIVPGNYREHVGSLPGILRQAKVQRGSSTVVRHNPITQVWEQAAEVINQG